MHKRWAFWFSGLTIALVAFASFGPLARGVAARTWATVSNGNTGDNVYTVQAMLKQRGYSLTVDGDFGPGTLSAVKSFQSSKGLSADGVVGPNTWEQLVIVVRSGDNNIVVNALQRQLRKHGHSLTVDGDFGAGTLSAVKSFQSSKGLGADGIVGADTWAALTGNASGGGGSTRADLARTIRDSSRIALATIHTSGVSDSATARQNIVDTANGGAARRSSYGNAPGGSVNLATSLLNGMITLSQSWSYSVSEIAGGSHSATSRHYAGVAVDVNVINGSHVSASHPNQQSFRNKCANLGATEVLGPGDSGHSTHIHCAWPRP
ncbi:peptidoglycan-binding domain-containing protein [Herpetosiphon llansteffanensis]|uniref:peptidoglycan-binding domain-containing protein n=1 Tax=Herpetosiphon llansteffanensis TaxID=2094568 RepID=UPI000D7C0F46|nr:peptidoglycan-binding protein [Herpetosiphon llansteffanensis]